MNNDTMSGPSMRFKKGRQSMKQRVEKYTRRLSMATGKLRSTDRCSEGSDTAEFSFESVSDTPGLSDSVFPRSPIVSPKRRPMSAVEKRRSSSLDERTGSGKSIDSANLSNSPSSNGHGEDYKLSPLQENSSTLPTGHKGSPSSSHQEGLKSGYLKKLGSNNFKNWSERWFVVKGDSLHYYKDPESKHLGTIPLLGSKVNVLPAKAKDSNKYTFEITPGADRMKPNNNHESYVLSANSPADMEEWVKVIRRVILAPFGGGIFGQRLDETMRYDRRLDSSGCGTTSTGSRSGSSSRGSRRQVPIIVENCVEFIRSHGGLIEEGLFRLPGHANEVKELQDSYDMGERPTFPGNTDVHTVASLLKGYLRELPEPVIPFEKYDPLIGAAKLLSSDVTDDISEKKNEEARILFREQLQALPQSNFELLRYICRFLDEVQQQSKKNKMDVNNLAMVFGPNIMRSKQEDPMQMMSDASYVQEVMKQFISKHKSFFPDDIENNSNIPSIPDVAVDAEGIPPDAGFGTLTPTTSPLGTLGQRHATDDSGTGSLGPTPENTSKRAAPPVPVVPPPIRGKPFKPLRRKHSGLDVEGADQRKSVYDNVTASSQAGSDITPTKALSARLNNDWRKSNESGASPSVSVPTEDSYYVNNVSTPSVQSANISDSPRSSTNAVAGSVGERDSFHSNPANDQPLPRSRAGRRKGRIRSIDENLSDEESNTESVPPDDRAFSTLSSHRGSIPTEADLHRDPRTVIDTRSPGGRLSRSDLASRSSVGSGSDGGSHFVPKVPSRTHRRNKASNSQDSGSRPNSRAETDLTSASAAIRDRDVIVPFSARTSHAMSSESPSVCGQPLSYKEMEEHVKVLQEELRKQRLEHEKRSRMLEEHYIMKMKSSTSIFPSSPTSMGPIDLPLGRGRIFSNGEESIGESCTTSVLEQQLDQSMLSRQSTESVTELRYREEVKRHAMTRIRLRNAERGLKQAEERNQQLQKEMEEFFNTFGGMLANNV
uniref:rho GTPase-activating protein 22 isoform X3 n=1 Tax=Ciona intestinalis TaxID=7719 RepID=UPI000180CDF3|nr:rho GTPase-activating protein 22 isoform X3 [Ciona intestinalis]|eukprot:XP_002131601.1 rho GTPase-activating protein 22 isoform X3 [Ciona intestinalis]